MVRVLEGGRKSWVPEWEATTAPAAQQLARPQQPLRFDVFQISLHFLHRYGKLEANAVALVHGEDLRGDSEVSGAGQGAGEPPGRGQG